MKYIMEKYMNKIMLGIFLTMSSNIFALNNTDVRPLLKKVAEQNRRIAQEKIIMKELKEVLNRVESKDTDNVTVGEVKEIARLLSLLEASKK